MLRTILLLTLCSFGSGIHAQSLTVQAIELYFPSSQGSAEIPEVSQFINGARDPSVFRSGGFIDSERRLNYTESGFAIHFVLRNDSSSVHEWMGGISTTNATGDLYELTGSVNGEMVNSIISIQAGYFNLHGGYRYVFREGRTFTFRAGGMLSLGLPVSARTFEEIRTDTEMPSSNRFFSRRGISTDLSFPLEARFKIVRNVSTGFRLNPGFRIMSIDGTTVAMRNTGAHLNFAFELRD